MAITIKYVSSEDSRYPVENILTQNTSEFWVSTGLYPQEILIEFETEKQVKELTIQCTQIKKLEIEGSDDKNISKLAKIGEAEIMNTEGNMHRGNVQLKSGKYGLIKLEIVAGWDEFASIHYIKFS